MNKKQYAGLFAGVVATSVLTQGLFVYALQGQGSPAPVATTPAPVPTVTPSAPALQPVFEQALFDYLWKKTFHYSTFFESLDGFHYTGNSSVDGNQLIVATDPRPQAAAEVFKQPEWQGILSFNERSAFRTAVTIHEPKNMQSYITVGLHGGNGYGFKIEDGALYGVTHDGTKETSVRLMTVNNSSVYNLSARLEPKSEVAFYVNDRRLGAISSNLPTQGTVPVLQIMDVYVQTKDSEAKSIQLSFFDYMQTRGFKK